jgi:hypothetical protein
MPVTDQERAAALEEMPRWERVSEHMSEHMSAPTANFGDWAIKHEATIRALLTEPQWRKIESAPVNMDGIVWCKELVERNDIIGMVCEYSDGKRFISSQARGFIFTHWHPLPKAPHGIIVKEKKA